MREIEWRSPVDAFAPLAAERGAVFFHPGAHAAMPGWSFIAAFPATRVESRNGATLIDGGTSSLSPFEAVDALHRARRSDALSEAAPPFATGLAGFIGYECGAAIEPSVRLPASPYDLPDFSIGAYDACAAFDNARGRAFICFQSRSAADRLEAALGAGGAALNAAQDAFEPPLSLTPADQYRHSVAEAMERIRAGEFFQANLSQRFIIRARASFNAFSLFAAASASSSAPFGAFLPQEGAQILSLSPERFFAVKKQADESLLIVAEPIKGTRPRGRTPDADRRLLQELMNDPKDRAENVMIADLTRNDLSRICLNHSIAEAAVCEPVSHENVHHLVSRISGVLRPELTAADALMTLFPCGSITGAPKVQAMKAIAEIEGAGRGPYCGAIGYIDDRGGADFSVAIRIAIAEREKLTVPAGGGVTLRSDPDAEYRETLAKAHAWTRIVNDRDLAVA